MNYILFDDHSWDQLLPLTYTRPVSELRIGILKIREKWEKIFKAEISSFTRGHLHSRYPPSFEKDNILINSALMPSLQVTKIIKELPSGKGLFSSQNRLLALRFPENEAREYINNPSAIKNKTILSEDVRIIDRPWHIFTGNGEEIRNDFTLITSGRKSVKLSKSNNIIGENIFAEEGAKAEYVSINTSTGPVYLGLNSEIMEGSAIRGPFALCDYSIIKMGAKIYGPTTIGPVCKAGGEINNSVLQGYSNKGHEGFLGNSVIGEWCNLGAGTNNSNLKNNYSNVKLWSYPDNTFINTELQFCGLIMGDHSKCGINTMFNTGTVVGVNANIFGSGYHPNFIPSFSWGGPNEFQVYSFDKAMEVAAKVMAQRNVNIDDSDRSILQQVFDLTEKSRV